MTSPIYWQMVGFVGQGIFTARFLVQWAASEKKGDSVVPIAFWWLSILGGFNVLIYAIHRRDPVFIVGQSLGMVVYVRNLMLVARKRSRASKVAGRSVGFDEWMHGPHDDGVGLASQFEGSRQGSG
jgi:lipid-A-disaccharide synthase-like uncharacterized protein